MNKEEPVIEQLLSALYAMQVQSLIVEGGAILLQSFIDTGLWDEARVIVNEQLTTGNGLKAPVLKNHLFEYIQQINNDSISFYKKMRL